jgi:hypothetical protein
MPEFQTSLDNSIDIKIFNKVASMFSERFRFKGNSWFNHCLERFRTVEQVSKNKFKVKGFPEFGDSKKQYTVTFTGVNIYGEEEFLCPCYFTSDKSWGIHRKQKLCTHVGAVILYMMYQRELKRQKENKTTEVNL